MKRQYRVPVLAKRIRGAFCPLIAKGRGACFVSGSEDCNVKLYDEAREDMSAINELMGHGAVVLDVAWNYDESLLGTCDDAGVVILWKRVKS